MTKIVLLRTCFCVGRFVDLLNLSSLAMSWRNECPSPQNFYRLQDHVEAKLTCSSSAATQHRLPACPKLPIPQRQDLVHSQKTGTLAGPTIKPSPQLSMPSNSSFEQKVGFGASSCEYSVPSMTHLEHE